MKSLLVLMLLPLTAFGKNCFRERTSFFESDFEVKVSHYQKESPSKKTIIIVPPTGGINVLDRSYGRILCSHDYNVWIIETFTEEDEYNLELTIHQRYYARYQRAIGMVLKHIPEDQEIGILGTSVGAFHAAIAAGIQPRIKSVFSIAGGADIASIIVDSDQKAMRVAREKRMELYNFKNRDDYYDALSEIIILEPLKYDYSSKTTGLMIAKSDETVPTRNQNLLKGHWKPKEENVLELSGGHFSTIVRTWLFHSHAIVDFFNKGLPRSE